MLTQGHPAVLISEKCGIAQAGPHHAFVALSDLGGIAALYITDGDEPAGQLAVSSLHRKITLMILHGRDHHLARQAQKSLFELSRDRHRPLDQRGDLIEESA